MKQVSLIKKQKLPQKNLKTNMAQTKIIAHNATL
jgi:hypothetical protein